MFQYLRWYPAIDYSDHESPFHQQPVWKADLPCRNAFSHSNASTMFSLLVALYYHHDCHGSWFYALCCVLCLMFWYFVPFLCLFSVLLCALASMFSPLSFPFPPCMFVSLCQYCFLHAFSSVSFPHYSTCPPPSSLLSPLSLPVPRSLISVSVFKPWFPMYSLSVPLVFLFDLNFAFLFALKGFCFLLYFLVPGCIFVCSLGLLHSAFVK